LTVYKKELTHPAMYILQYQRLRRETYRGHIPIFTDGSKYDNRVGAAAVCGETRKTISLPNAASIFTAELHALEMAFQIARNLNEELFVIFSDSLSALITLQNKRTPHPLARILQHQIDNLNQEGKTVKLCWIPSHVGIDGNESADKLAKAAALLPAEHIMIFYADWYPIIANKIHTRWKENWQREGKFLLKIQTDPGSRKREQLSRRNEVVLNRLRCGHTRLTHEYLMNSAVQEPPPGCPLCLRTRLTVHHVIIDCPVLSNARRQYISLFADDHHPPRTIKDVLGGSAHIAEVLQFLQKINAYDLI
jgi:ribonuclease HI